MNIKLIFVLWYLPLPHRLYSTFGFAKPGEMDGEEVIAALKL